MTTWKLDLRTTDYDGPVDVLAALETTIPAVIAATLRAVADRLDPPHLGRTPSEGLAIIAAAERREAADRRFREKLAGYGDTDAMVCPDCIGDRHTHQPGRCALPPPWNGVSVLDPDTPRRRRPGRTVETDLDRAAKNDGCGSEHTHTGSCAYTVVERINPDV